MDICQASKLSLRLSRVVVRPTTTIVRGFNSTRRQSQDAADTNNAPSVPQNSTPRSSYSPVNLFAEAMEPRSTAAGSVGSFGHRRSVIRDRARAGEQSSDGPMAELFDAFEMKNKKGVAVLRKAPAEQVVKPLLKLGPNVGRSFAVDAVRGMDVARAFRQLDAACNKNRVRNDFMKQRFHERPGLKRKRIRYEGKLKGFKGRFIKVVQMVQKMTKSGW